MEIFLHSGTWIALVTLTLLEIILGIDNLIFISLSANKLHEQQQKKATFVGLTLAMMIRILLLLSISYIIALKNPFLTIQTVWLSASFTGQSLILFIGGVFLLYKSTKEIHQKIESMNTSEKTQLPNTTPVFSNVIIQIVLIDIVFSFDSILTAIGMTNGIDGDLTIMILAVVISMFVMMIFANSISAFIRMNPTLQILALSFLILLGFMLITEAAHLSFLKIFNKSVGAIPKGYLYFALLFSLGVEVLNFRVRKASNHQESQKT